MSDRKTPFAAFRESILSPELGVIADHWNEARGSRRLPIWRDIDPAAIARHLTLVWAWRWDEEQGDFIGRLAGEQLQKLVDASIRGRPFKEIFGDSAPALREAFQDVLGTPALVHCTGKVYGFNWRQIVGERIILPIDEDAGGGGGVFGATTIEVAANLDDGQATAAVRENKMERFPLF